MNIATTAEVVSKSQFAALKNVTPGRVSQWIAEGKITSASIEGEGRSAKINVERADADLRRKLDLGQRTGNGLATRLGPTPAPATPAPTESREPTPSAPSPANNLDEQFKREKLEGLQRENRKRAEEEAARAGRYVDAQLARVEMVKIAAQVITIFEGALPEIAATVAAKFAMPQRDVLHLLRQEFRTLRDRATKSFRDQAATRGDTIEVDVPDIEDVETI